MKRSKSAERWEFMTTPSSLFFLFFLKFSDKFREVKDAARLAREKSQDKELANSALTIAAPQVRL